MKKINKKFRDQHGVSILFALLLLLVVAMVSVVMISASVTAVKRTHSRKNVTQQSINMDSTALLIKNQVNQNNTVVVTYDSNTKQYTTNATGVLQVEMDKISKAVVMNDVNSSNGSFSIEVKNKDTVKVIGEINVEYHMKQKILPDNDSQLNAVFKLTNSEDLESQMYVHFSLNMQQIEDTGNQWNVQWTFTGISTKEDLQ